MCKRKGGGERGGGDLVKYRNDLAQNTQYAAKNLQKNDDENC